MTTSEKAHMLRFASSIVIAAYGKSTPHSSGVARLASGAFCEAAPKRACFGLQGYQAKEQT
jgi:hypothetical protein